MRLVFGSSNGPCVYESDSEITIRIPISPRERTNNQGDRALFLRAKTENACEQLIESIRLYDDRGVDV